jgi:outer membrane protein assembly factor BamB
MLKSKTKIFSIALLLVFVMPSGLMASVKTAEAQTTNVQPYAFMSVQPNPIGVGQNALVAFWFDMLPPVNRTTGYGTGWTGWMFTITFPDGTAQTMGPYHSDSVGSKSLMYVPQQTGTYYFQFTSPQQTQDAAPGFVFLSATSPKVALTVQQAPIEPLPQNSLPTGYWQRPINAQNRAWATIGGTWLGVATTQGAAGNDAYGGVNLYTTAPNTAHILWTKVHTIGGIVGGTVGIGQNEVKSFTAGASANSGITYYTGLSYESRYGPPIIINGYLYYNNPLGTSSNSGGVTCVDLRTGKQVWWQNITVSCGQVLSFQSPNQHGAIPYLWQTGSTYRMYDPLTGNLIMQFANASTGRITMDAQGDMLVYVLDGTRHWLAMWNSSYASYMHVNFQGTDEWRPQLGTIKDWRVGIQWNVTIPAVPISSTGLPGVTASTGESISTIGQNTIIASCQAGPTTVCAIGYDATTGAELFQTNITSNAAYRPAYFLTPANDGIFVFFRQETMQFYGYSLTTGRLLWGPTEAKTNAWGIYSSSGNGLGGENPLIAYGNLYSVGYDGYIYAYDDTNGNTLWSWYDGSSGFETPYGQNPLGGVMAIADNKVYAVTGEHSPSSPLPRNAKMYCVDALTGKEVWELLGWWQGTAVSDGVLTAFNSYDGQIYGIGKGNSATTVQTPLTGIAAGDTITITGTVTDQSPGQTCLGIPAAGTPAISDDSITAWMEYLYMQQPQPTNATGVQVQLVAIDSSGVSTIIDTVTSDSMGFFNTHWTASTTPGDYKIVANFAGTNAYYASSASAAITVVAAVPTPASANEVASQVVSQLPTQAPYPTSASASDVADQVVAQMPNLPSPDADTVIIAIGAVIAVLVAVNIAVSLRKQKK